MNAEEDDLRLLGRLLGDVIRQVEGEDAFDSIEQQRDFVWTSFDVVDPAHQVKAPA